MKKNFLAIIILAVLFVSCKSKKNSVTTTGTDSSKSNTAVKDLFNKNSSGSWSSKDKADFIQECVKNVPTSYSAADANTYCTCMEQKIENKYPDVQQVGNISNSEMEGLAQECKALLTGSTGSTGSGDGGSSSWTDTERETFVNSCVNSAASLGDRARPYCECSLEKVEKLYPNPRDVKNLSDAQTQSIATDCLK